MSNPSGTDPDDTPDPTAPERPADHDAEPTPPVDADATPTDEHGSDPDEQITDSHPAVPADTEDATEVFATEVLPTEPDAEAAEPAEKPPERRFTAPGFDAGNTEVIQPVPEPPTEVIRTQRGRLPKAAPQLIPPRLARKLPAATSRSWAWVLALILITLTLAAIAVLGTVWLTHGGRSKVSQEERVRDSILRFDTAVQNGDLPTLRSLTCGSVRDNYLNYNEQAWDDTYRRIAAAKQYPVVASVDEVIVNGDHAEANVTAFMAYAPKVRSTRSFDLQFRDDQWKICQTHAD